MIKKALIYLICSLIIIGLSQCKVVLQPQERHSSGDWLCTSKEMRQKALTYPIIDTVGICIFDRIPRESNKAALPKEYMDTISIYINQELLYKGTSHDLYLPYVGQKIQCFRYANTKRKKIASVKMVNERLKKEKIAALILVAIYGEDHRNWYYCDYDWNNPNLYLGDNFNMEDSRCLLKYK